MTETPDTDTLEQALALKDELTDLFASMTQREWLLITTKLDRSRAEIKSDEGLTLLATAWVKSRRDTTTPDAGIDQLLDLSDDGLMRHVGFTDELIEALPDDDQG